MQLIPVDHGQLATLRLGPADGVPTVMLHGMVNGSLASWYLTVALPMATARPVLLYDQRGHGDSPLTTAPHITHFDLDSQCEDLQTVLSHYGYAEGPIDLVGHSMGALIALRYALHQPQRVRRLVLVDAPMPAQRYVAPSLEGLDSPERIAALFGLDPQQLKTSRRGERARKRFSALLFDTSLLADLRAMDVEPDAQLAQLPCPVLLVYGRESPCLEAGQHLQQVLPQATLVLLNGGHYVPTEQPAALLQCIVEFLGAAAPAAQQSMTAPSASSSPSTPSPPAAQATQPPRN